MRTQQNKPPNIVQQNNNSGRTSLIPPKRKRDVGVSQTPSILSLNSKKIMPSTIQLADRYTNPFKKEQPKNTTSHHVLSHAYISKLYAKLGERQKSQVIRRFIPPPNILNVFHLLFAGFGIKIRKPNQKLFVKYSKKKPPEKNIGELTVEAYGKVNNDNNQPEIKVFYEDFEENLNFLNVLIPRLSFISDKELLGYKSILEPFIEWSGGNQMFGSKKRIEKSTDGDDVDEDIKYHSDRKGIDKQLDNSIKLTEKVKSINADDLVLFRFAKEKLSKKIPKIKNTKGNKKEISSLNEKTALLDKTNMDIIIKEINNYLGKKEILREQIMLSRSVINGVKLSKKEKDRYDKLTNIQNILNSRDSLIAESKIMLKRIGDIVRIEKPVPYKYEDWIFLKINKTLDEILVLPNYNQEMASKIVDFIKKKILELDYAGLFNKRGIKSISKYVLNDYIGRVGAFACSYKSVASLKLILSLLRNISESLIECLDKQKIYYDEEMTDYSYPSDDEKENRKKSIMELQKEVENRIKFVDTLKAITIMANR